MKKIFILLFTIAAYYSAFAQSNYTLNFDEQDFTFSETKNGYAVQSQSADYYLLGDTTLPALPYKNIYILVPENVDVENLKVTVKSEKKLQSVRLVSNPVVRPASKTDVISEDKVGCYAKEIYPDKNVKFETLVKSQGFYMAAFSVCPFIYHAQRQTLEFITEMSISFDQRKKAAAKSSYSGAERYDMEDVVKRLVVNPADVNMQCPQAKAPLTTSVTSAGGDVEYLIVTSESLKANFNPLKAWKIRKGIRTEILSTDYIYANYTGSTNQVKLKKCLQDYYANRNLKWLLLGGDNTVVPVQGCYGQYGSYIDGTMPCDLFYACFDNAFDWDANGNGVVGEEDDNIDMAPEIYISRAPARTAEHVNAFVNKTLVYETNPQMFNYIKNVLLSGVALVSSSANIAGESDAHWKSEQMYSNYITPYWPNGVKTRFYDTGTDFSGGASYDLTATNLQSVLNNGYHFVHMATHGGQTSWTMESGFTYLSSNAQSQINSKQSIIVTIACLTNAFDTDEPCLSEAFIRNPSGGSILYWGSSRYGWTITSWYFSQQFFQKLFSGEPGKDAYKFGALTASSKSYYISSSLNYNYAERWLQFSLNAIGDPELSIYTEDPARFSNAYVFVSGAHVTVSTGGVAGCTIALTSTDNGQSYFKVAEDVSSYTFTDVPVGIPYNITVSKHNYIPYQGYLASVNCTTINLANQTVSSNRTVTSPCNIKVQDVTVTNGAKLILDAVHDVNITSGFEVQLGSELEVK